ncbi:MAG: hypothetical protein LBB14_01190 [Puniceicoccales bacterium]|jgi:hypothetical protein|nr:hypothetical protein [Puniceicoccales bacterium]
MRAIPFCVIVSALCALLFPSGPAAPAAPDRPEPPAFALLFAASVGWNPVPGAEVYFPGPHCVRPAPAESRKNAISPEGDYLRWNDIFLAPWTLEDFQLLQYWTLLQSFIAEGGN